MQWQGQRRVYASELGVSIVLRPYIYNVTTEH